MGIGLLLYSPIAYFLLKSGLYEAFGLGLVAMAFWSFAPDIDVYLPIRHRGPTHSFVAAGIAGLLTASIATYFASTGIGGEGSIVIRSSTVAYLAAAAFGFFIGAFGVISHLLGDAITPMQIRPWWPFSDKKHGIKLVLAKNKRANQTLSFAGAIALTGAMVFAELA
jgi:inner membrane protein